MKQVESSETNTALMKLITQHQAGVWRYLRALGCDVPLAEDLTQETFLAVLQKPFEDYDPAATASYLRKVARNLLLTHRRKENPHFAIEDWQQAEQSWTRWVSNESKHDNGEALLNALAICFEKLSERAQQALNLRYRDKNTRQQIAEQLDMSPDGAKNLLQRSKQTLRECISKNLD